MQAALEQHQDEDADQADRVDESVAASTIGSTMKSVTEARGEQGGVKVGRQSGHGKPRQAAWEDRVATMARILYVNSRRNTFTRIDREALEERHEVVDYLQEGFRPRPAELWRKVGECDAIVGWFASWHTALALRFARMRGKPSLLIFGGFDTAAMPEIGYGSQRGGVRRRLVRSTASLATRLVTNSEVRRLARSPSATSRDRPRAGGGGLSRRPRPLPERGSGRSRERMALTVGAVYSVNLAAQGPRAVRGGRRGSCPTSSACSPGEWWDDTGERLASEGRPEPPDHRLPLRRRPGRRSSGAAAVYVQASLHEGFGMSLAEAMLAGAVPVVDHGRRPAGGRGRNRRHDRRADAGSRRGGRQRGARTGTRGRPGRPRAHPHRVPVLQAPRRPPARGRSALAGERS